MTTHLENRVYFMPVSIREELQNLVTNRYITADAAIDVCISHGVYVYRELAKKHQFRSFTSASTSNGSPIAFSDLREEPDGDFTLVPLRLSVKTLDLLADFAIESRVSIETILAKSIDAACLLLAVRKEKAQLWLCDSQGKRLNNLTFLTL